MNIEDYGLEEFGHLLVPGLLKDRLSAEFLTPAHYKVLPDGRWRVLAEMRVKITEFDEFGRVSEERIRVVPEGFETDLASVPRELPIAYAWLGGRARLSAPFHDFAYQTQLGKDLADAEFFACVLEEEKDRAVADAMWLGVHVGGQGPYDRYGAPSA